MITVMAAPRIILETQSPASAWLQVVVHLHPVIRYLILLHFVLLHLVYVLPQQFVVTNTAPTLVPIFQTIPV